MKINYRLIVISALLLMFGMSSVHAQGRLLRRIQEEAEKKAVEEIFKGRESETTPAGESEEARRAAANRRGTGLAGTTTDVNQSIASAEASLSASDYKAAKNALREALWGVELEIGQNVLKSLPETVASLKAELGSDKVTSSGIGFVGLLIERFYQGRDEMELALSIGNDAALLGVANIYMAGGYYQQSTDQTNQKQIRFQNHQGVIQFEEHSGFTLSVPFGQSSIFVLKGVNFETENDFMAAANQFKLDDIKQKLGVQ